MLYAVTSREQFPFEESQHTYTAITYWFHPLNWSSTCMERFGGNIYGTRLQISNTCQQSHSNVIAKQQNWLMDYRQWRLSLTGTSVIHRSAKKKQLHIPLQMHMFLYFFTGSNDPSNDSIPVNEAYVEIGDNFLQTRNKRQSADNCFPLQSPSIYIAPQKSAPCVHGASQIKPLSLTAKSVVSKTCGVSFHEQTERAR